MISASYAWPITTTTVCLSIKKLNPFVLFFFVVEIVSLAYKSKVIEAIERGEQVTEVKLGRMR